MTEDQRREWLLDLGLNPDGGKLTEGPVQTPVRTEPTNSKVEPADPVDPKPEIRWAPDGVDPHSMKVEQIVFTEDMLRNPETGKDFKLDKSDCKAASAHVFKHFVGPHKDTDRHSHLHSRISAFIGQVKRSRATGGFVRERVNTNATQRQLAQILAAGDVTEEELVTFVKALRNQTQTTMPEEGA